MSNKLHTTLDHYKQVFQEIREIDIQNYFDRTELLGQIRKLQEQINQEIKDYEDQQLSQKIQQKMKRYKFMGHEHREAVYLKPKHLTDKNQSSERQTIQRVKQKQVIKQRLKKVIEANSELSFRISIKKMMLMKNKAKFSNIPTRIGSEWINCTQIPVQFFQNFTLLFYHLNSRDNAQNLYFLGNSPLNIGQTSYQMKSKHIDIHGNIYENSSPNFAINPKAIKLQLQHTLYSDNYQLKINELASQNLVFLFETSWSNIIGKCEISASDWLPILEQQQNRTRGRHKNERKKQRKIVLHFKQIQPQNKKQTYWNCFPEEGNLIFSLEAFISIQNKPTAPPYIDLIKLNLQKFYSQDTYRHKKILSKSPQGKRSQSPIAKKLVIKSLIDHVKPPNLENISKYNMQGAFRSIIEASKPPPSIKLKVLNNSPLYLNIPQNRSYQQFGQIVIEQQRNISRKNIQIIQDGTYLLIEAELKNKNLENSDKHKSKEKTSTYRINRKDLINDVVKEFEEEREGKIVFKINYQRFEVHVLEDDNYREVGLDESRIKLRDLEHAKYEQLNFIIKFNDYVYLRPNYNTKIIKNPIDQICTFNCLTPYYFKTELGKFSTNNNPSQSNDLLDVQIYPALKIKLKSNENDSMLYYIVPETEQFRRKQITVVVSIREKLDTKIEGKKIRPVSKNIELHYFTCILQPCRSEIVKQLQVKEVGFYDLDVSSIIRKSGKYIVRSLDEEVLSVATVFLNESEKVRQSKNEKSSKGINSNIEIMLQLRKVIQYEKSVIIVFDDTDKNMSTCLTVKLVNKRT